jgi:hypothetical protein
MRRLYDLAAAQKEGKGRYPVYDSTAGDGTDWEGGTLAIVEDEDRGQPLARLMDQAGYREQCRNHNFGLLASLNHNASITDVQGCKKLLVSAFQDVARKKGVVGGGWPKRGLMRKSTSGLSALTNIPVGGAKIKTIIDLAHQQPVTEYRQG